MSAQTIWIKICGNTNLEDALLAVDAGADALGFIFAPSPRRVTAAQVAAITPLLPPAIEKIGVFVDAPLEEIVAAVDQCGLTGVQLHSDAAADFPAMLHQRFGPQLSIIRVVHFNPEAAGQIASEIAILDNDPQIKAILIDSRTPTAVGGTGVPFDWAAARAAIFQNPKAKPRIAAGGLTPANVAEAIATLRPWGIDVASGVESAPGRKDPAKIRAFIANAKAAAGLL
jgi:phosphoribosylanthranilate isomerase